MTRVVVVGASVAGVKTAQALRAEGFSGQITLVDADPTPCAYDRPPLSKEFLLGPLGPDDIALLSPQELSALGAEFVWGRRATSLDLVRRRVELDGGAGGVDFDVLVIATGARAVPGPWAPHPRVVTLRTLEDAVRLRDLLGEGARVAVIGAGFIGAEIAATARGLGASVSLVDVAEGPMARVLPPSVGAVFAEKYRAEGVDVRFGRSVVDVSAGAEGATVSLDDGSVLDVDVVVVGVGARVATEWLEGSGLLLDDGVVCDLSLRAVGADGVFAVGDVARWRSGSDASAGRRSEHWTSAAEQAAVVAHNIVFPDASREHVPAPYVWSVQFDWKIHVIGETVADPALVLGSGGAGRFAALWGDLSGMLAGAVVVNWPKAQVSCRRALGSPVLVAELAESLGAAPLGASRGLAGEPVA